MSKPEVQTLVAAISRRCEIVLPLLPRHRIPLGLALLVDVDVEEFRGNQQDKVVASDSDQDLVAAVVIWRIIGAIDVNA
jgi:hypothetical protein